MVLSTMDLKKRMDYISQVVSEVMVKGVHYDVIPGTQKPTLLLPGAQKLLTTFRIAVIAEEFEDLSTPDMIRYRTKVTGAVDGEPVGIGIGECSSAEEKFQWKKAVCEEEYNETPENRRRKKWARGSGGRPYSVQQVRTNPADQANTVLKMADKRARVHLALSVLAASDMFSQDMEDRPPVSGGGRPRPQRATAVQEMVQTAVNTMGLSPDDVQSVATKLGLGTSATWSMADGDAVIAELEKLKM
jgi:hypothetical protein